MNMGMSTTHSQMNKNIGQMLEVSESIERKMINVPEGASLELMTTRK